MEKDFAFFQQAVLSIISELDFNNSLMNAFQFLKTYFPLEAITIDQYSPEKRCISILCVVSKNGVLNARHFVPLDDDSAQFMDKRSQSRSILNIVDSVQIDITKAHSQELQAVLPFKPRGYLVGHLTSGNVWVGDLAFIGSKPNCFTARHEHLLGMLLAPFSLAINNRLHLKSLMASKKQSDEERDKLRQKLRELHIPAVIGENGGLREVMNSVRQLDGKDTTVLLLGETGTGKEVIANAIQNLSRRRDARFIRVNCGALPESLVDSELFGYEKGSFTGAESLRIGRFEQADGGTLFLDEVGELTLSAQVRLLRVLQDGIVERIGSVRPTPVNVRIIAATNRDLARMRQEGTFREDLFHRLNTFPIRIPPLRDRKEDIPELVRHFVERISRRMEIFPPPEVLPESLERAGLYAWPGNVRELENIVERALILDPTGPLDIGRDLLLSGAGGLPDNESCPPKAAGKTATPFGQTNECGQANECCLDGERLYRLLGETFLSRMIDERIAAALVKMQLQSTTSSDAASLNEAMSAHIREALAACNGKVSGPGGAAEVLGINHSTLRNRMKKLGIKPR